ncbi:DUF4145 domain-containing protein [Gracilibacillus caseinilyticus]|uniref:DUF4145 domain-containing protein n=1 Tax=Gracilibacillus caseinilyticus TaxID=2932256 RepID=A0ABY4ESY5_9BACI|nr:DUF4145 domain-containing protein [Gracilibacillus caseinilyticus]UOQ47374.1 DUF4145 domain-containing protein [Gracilibacillus caseinilyticus]
MEDVKQNYFYYFLNELSHDLAAIARELEFSVFSSPRTMLTHSRAFIENLVQRVLRIEEIDAGESNNLNDQIKLLQTNGLLTESPYEALDRIRHLGNQAAHQLRAFRYREALEAWEALYVVMKWYVEVYGSPSITVPTYQEPSLTTDHKYDIQELELKLHALEQRLVDHFQSMTETEVQEERHFTEQTVSLPGETIIRTITYKQQSIDIPYFLRDAFLLPQRFENSTRFMVALGGVQQARIMSELPEDLEGISTFVKRYKAENEQQMYDDLVRFVKQEWTRRKIAHQRPGELLLFFRNQHLIMTERLANIPLTDSYFTGFPYFLRQMHHDGIEYVGQLPQELFILAKYDRVGSTTVEKFFTQIQALAQANNEHK